MDTYLELALYERPVFYFARACDNSPYFLCDSAKEINKETIYSQLVRNMGTMVFRK